MNGVAKRGSSVNVHCVSRVVDNSLLGDSCGSACLATDLYRVTGRETWSLAVRDGHTQCPECGCVGQDDGRGLVRLATPTQAIHPQSFETASVGQQNLYNNWTSSRQSVGGYKEQRCGLRNRDVALSLYRPLAF